jgi:DNA repair protein RecO (recombination protein O)
MNVVSSECIILRQRDFKERDRLITFLARDRGKLSGIAKGAKVITGRGVGAYEPFTRCILYYAEKPSGGLVQIRKCDLVPPYLYLQSDYERFLHFTYLTELIELSSIASADSEAFFMLLAQGLERAAALPREALPGLRLEFELDLLRALGVQPEWKRCIACGEPIFLRRPDGSGTRVIHPRRLATHQFDVPGGGLRCPSCHEAGRGRFDLAPRTLAAFAAWRAARPHSGSRAAGQPLSKGEGRSVPTSLAESSPSLLERGPGGEATAAAPSQFEKVPSSPLIARGSSSEPPNEEPVPKLEEPARRELERAVRAHLLHHLERRPRSLTLMEEAERGAIEGSTAPLRSRETKDPSRAGSRSPSAASGSRSLKEDRG